MRAKATLFWICLAAVVGFGLFHVKYKVQALEEKLAKLNSEIVRGQEQLHVLHAEWSYLNRPDRLEELNARFLGLGPMTPKQIGRLGELPLRPASVEDEAAAKDARKDTGQ